MKRTQPKFPIDEIITEMSTDSIVDGPPDASGPAKKPIRFLSYNFFLRPPPVYSNKGDHKDDRLAYFIEHFLEKYDVIAFQEVFSLFNSRRQTLIQAAHDRGFHYFAESQAPGFFSGSVSDGGLLTVSRYPIAYSKFYSYQTPAVESDALCDKGLLYTKIDVSSSLSRKG
jgi:endonuclease/exonuclease/phosphatase family metal-dependent hydrolase